MFVALRKYEAERLVLFSVGPTTLWGSSSGQVLLNFSCFLDGITTILEYGTQACIGNLLTIPKSSFSHCTGLETQIYILLNSIEAGSSEILTA